MQNQAARVARAQCLKRAGGKLSGLLPFHVGEGANAQAVCIGMAPKQLSLWWAEAGLSIGCWTGLVCRCNRMPTSKLSQVKPSQVKSSQAKPSHINDRLCERCLR